MNVGCGDGHFETFLKKNYKEVYGIDVNENDIQIAKFLNPEKSVKHLVGSVYKLPFKPNYFDCVVATEVLEHLDDDKTAIKEIYRILKKRGKLIITVPYKNYPFTYDPINFILDRTIKKHLPIGVWGFGHVRLYDKSRLRKLLGKKFKIEKINTVLHSLVGIPENYYLINILQPLTKSDPLNKDAKKKDIETLKRRALKKPSLPLRLIRNSIIRLDEKLFKGSEYSLNLILKAEKK